MFAKNPFNYGDIIAEFRGPLINTKDCFNPVFDYAERMTYIDENYSMIANSIATYANDIIKFDINKFETEEYNNWI